MRRGEVWWADLPEPYARRPVVTISRDSAYDMLHQVTIACVTTRIRHIPSEVLLGASEGLHRECAANFDHILAVSKDALTERVGALSPAKLRELDAAIRFALGLER